MSEILHIVFRSIRFYKKPVVYQILIIALLSAIITGSILTGRSVKVSLRKSASERLGNTGFLVSSGVRYFDESLAVRLKEAAGINVTGLLEINGYSQSIGSQKGAFKTQIFGVNPDFFVFHGNNQTTIKPGEIAVNKYLSDYLGVEVGDEIIIRFKGLSDIPADAPFAPAKGAVNSIAMKIGLILDKEEPANFSLSISQVMPKNIFINLSDLAEATSFEKKLNRLLIEANIEYSQTDVFNSLKKILKPSDIGLNLRMVNKSGQFELISDRVFIDELLVKEIENSIPSAAPIITYLANRITKRDKSTPYSFVSALPFSLYREITSDNDIIINDWLAKDLAAGVGDTIIMYWYSPDSLNKLIENSNRFIVKRIVNISGVWADSLLMPEFPGISGSESCSGWDAGVPVAIDEIRPRDEEYWNEHKGTPKAFINYDTGKKIWGNNFGPATSVRFPSMISREAIESGLMSSLSPDLTGFHIINISEQAVDAANKSVDFSTLFLSLGFFLIVSSLVLLSFAVTSYFDAKSYHVKIFHSLGFKKSWIKKLLLLESGSIAILGAFLGSVAGFLVSMLIIKALNSVWRGAVQTNTLEAYFNFIPLFVGFLLTFVTAGILMMVKLTRYLKIIHQKEKFRGENNHSKKGNLILLVTSSIISILLFILSHVWNDNETSYSFAAGTALLISFILFWRQYYLGFRVNPPSDISHKIRLSRIYYGYYPSHGITPIIFIAAGIFSVFITGANRMSFDINQLDRSGGTGGFLIWCENTIPVKEDLNSVQGRMEAGLDDESMKAIHFVQVKKSSGDDASCLNLNHVSSPPILGIDPAYFISKASFSFSKVLDRKDLDNPWQYLNIPPSENTIYGIADQTVLQWGLMLKQGDTLILRSEDGQPLNIIMAAGLKSSVFQGNVLIGMDNFMKYFPSVSGSSILLVDGDPGLTELYKTTLNERLQNFGINSELTTERLASFYEVTNTYLSVFVVFGAFGMITGIAGLGFVLLRNYNHRKREFALMMATGFNIRRIRSIILSEQSVILFAGISSGAISALVATLPSIKSSPDVPWLFLLTMIILVFATGLITLLISVRSVTAESLKERLRLE